MNKKLEAGWVESDTRAAVVLTIQTSKTRLTGFAARGPRIASDQ